jgi:hypothetical protein
MQKKTNEHEYIYIYNKLIHNKNYSYTFVLIFPPPPLAAVIAANRLCASSSLDGAGGAEGVVEAVADDRNEEKPPVAEAGVFVVGARVCADPGN